MDKTDVYYNLYVSGFATQLSTAQRLSVLCSQQTQRTLSESDSGPPSVKTQYTFGVLSTNGVGPTLPTLLKFGTLIGLPDSIRMSRLYRDTH